MRIAKHMYAVVAMSALIAGYAAQASSAGSEDDVVKFDSENLGNIAERFNENNASKIIVSGEARKQRVTGALDLHHPESLAMVVGFSNKNFRVEHRGTDYYIDIAPDGITACGWMLGDGASLIKPNSNKVHFDPGPGSLSLITHAFNACNASPKFRVVDAHAASIQHEAFLDIGDPRALMWMLQRQPQLDVRQVGDDIEIRSRNSRRR